MKNKNPKKNINDFVDSSEDESILLDDPYPRLPFVDPQDISPLLAIRMENIRTHKEILGKEPLPHQKLLTKPAISIKYKKSPFPAPLAPVNTIDALPSNPAKQKDYTDSIVPAFRGITLNNNLSSAELFCFTRADWINTRHFASMTFKIAEIDIATYTKSFLVDNKDFLQKYDHYNLNSLVNNAEDFTEQKKKLTAAAKKLKAFFKCADKISKPFNLWKKMFKDIKIDMRNINDIKIAKQAFTLSEILAYIYVNSYAKFKEVMLDFESILTTVKNEDLTNSFNELQIPADSLDAGMYHLSEGQIPRHALLYAFGLKNYTKGKEQEAIPLYSEDLKPKEGKVYLGKLMVSSNPHTLFTTKDKALFIPDFDAKHGNKIIAKTILPEKEIQHRGANLQGKIKNSVNIKLPKFHHRKAPKRYLAKYGLDDSYYKNLKETFTFLLTKKQFGKLGWMYLETILLAHLLQFHEFQLYNYCSQLAYESEKDIRWFNRNLKKIDDPFPLEFDSSFDESSLS